MSRRKTHTWFIRTALVFALFVFTASSLKLFDPLPLEAAASSSRLVLDRDGRLLRAFTTPEGRWRLDASPEDVSPTYLALLFAFEDHRFWRHPGIDPLAFGRAVLQAVAHGKPISGGSTLTMQVARLLRGSPTHSLTAKFQQIADAARLEWALSKRDILSLYLKLAPYGGNLEGVRAASLAYFGKEPHRLSIAEAALLVTIPQSPEVRRPDRGYQSLVNGRNRVIRRAAAAGAISQKDANAALAQAVPRGRRDFPTLAPHISERLTAGLPNQSAIATTIDRNLQEAAETIAHRNAQSFGEKISIAAMIVENRTGEVLAHVGSAGYFDDARQGAIDMTTAIRSPGSALKPFIYGLAFEEGLAHPETLIEDRPVRFDGYAPVNFDNVFHGRVTVRTALQLSLNIPAVKVLNEVSPVKLAARLREAGLPFAMPRNLTVALGGAGLTLENLATLYVGLARGGSVIPLRYQKESGPVWGGDAPPVLLQPAAAWYVSDILRGAPVPPNVTPGAVAFKTGTSYGFRDAWTAGFDGEHAVAVWAGRADASAVPGLVGLRVAAPVLFELFSAIGPHRAPFASAPPNIIGTRKTADLPPPLRMFRELKREASGGPGHEQALHIAFPPPNSDVEIASTEGQQADKLPVALKAEGGTLPLTWLVDGAPIASSPHRREAFLKPAGPGFVQITVVDSEGHSARTQIRLR